VLAVNTLLVIAYAGTLVVLAMRGRRAPFLFGVAVCASLFGTLTLTLKGRQAEYLLPFRLAAILLETLPASDSVERSTSLAMLAGLTVIGLLTAVFGWFAQRAVGVTASKNDLVDDHDGGAP